MKRKFTNKDDVRKATYEDMINLLDTYKECAVIRPTGFGKTFLLTELISSSRYSNVLYLYPAEVIKNTVVNKYVEDNFSDYDEETKETLKQLESFDGVTLMTYAKLIRLEDREFKEMSFDLVVCDECHRLGGEKTKYAIGKLKEYLPDAHFVGATATPNRSDSFDVIDAFYNNHVVFEYTFHDAFEDGLLQRPNYCYCTYDAETDLKDAALTAGEDFENVKVWEVLKKGLIEISRIYNLPNIIKNVCEQYACNEGHDKNYYKFIVFSSSIDDLNDKKNTVRKWFKDAFGSDMRIRELIISSETPEYVNNVNKLHEFKCRKNTIDLIFCVNMLNMGYHVNDITGILMYRCTNSDIIYIQQLGRALSSGNENSCIVFDVVDNLHRKALFDYSEDEFLGGLTGIDGIVPVDGGSDGGPSTIIGGPDGGEEGGEDDIPPVDVGPVGGGDWWKGPGITPMDLNAVGNIATYKELIAKIVAEPMAQRCKEAFNAHFKRWCILNEIDYPISDKKLKELYDLDKEDFIKYFKRVIKRNHLNYPMGDAEELLRIGKKRKDGISMEIFARWKNVSVASILELLNIA